MTPTLLKDVPHNVTFVLVGTKELGHWRLVTSRDSRNIEGETRSYIAPYYDGRVFIDRGRWTNWTTEVQII